jgi:phosphomannomutase / phosphoglucomutase
MIEKEIFREYDIRGIYGKNLDEKTARSIGWAYGKILADGRRNGSLPVVVGRDCRKSSEALSCALIDGLSAQGIEVLDIGLSPTPLLYFSLHRMATDGGIMITASHNPPEYNGFKVCIGKDTIFGDAIQRLYRTALDAPVVGPGNRNVTHVDIVGPYTDYMLENLGSLVGMGPDNAITCVVDSGNGTAGPVVPGLLRRFGITVHELFSEPDGDFPNHHPDPTDEVNLGDLIAKVRETQADLGIAFDGDSDRIGVVDGAGRILRGDQLLLILAEAVIAENPGAICIGEVKCSRVMYDGIRHLGGNPIMWKTGHSLIKQKMRETGALLAGEMSGHIFFKHRYFGYDDAIYAALRLLEILARRPAGGRRKLTDIVDRLPKMVNTPEIRITCNESDKFRIVDEIKKTLDGHRYQDIDGVRIEFPDGWGLIRASNTQPALILRFEADTQERLEEIRGLIEQKLQIAMTRIT